MDCCKVDSSLHRLVTGKLPLLGQHGRQATGALRNGHLPEHLGSSETDVDKQVSGADRSQTCTTDLSL